MQCARLGSSPELWGQGAPHVGCCTVLCAVLGGYGVYKLKLFLPKSIERPLLITVWGKSTGLWLSLFGQGCQVVVCCPLCLLAAFHM